MTIAVASGKGGTGKTTFSVSLAVSLAGQKRHNQRAQTTAVQLLDCDVEEPNDNLYLQAQVMSRHPVEVQKPRLVADRCDGCGKCVKACAFNSIAVTGGKAMLFPELCHGCGVCTHVCPTGALEDESVKVGEIQVFDSLQPFLVAGALSVGFTESATVIEAVKEYINKESINIIDAPPGTSCPVVRSLEGSDAVVLVTEPTPFGLHDLELAAGLTRMLRLPAAIVVNQSDGKDACVARLADEIGLPIIGRIPYRRAFAEACSEGLILADVFPEVRDIVLDIHDNLSLCRTAQPAGKQQQSAAPTAKPDRAASAPSVFWGSRPAGQPETPDRTGGQRGLKAPEVVVVSGKGGTGKTSLAAAFTRLSGSLVIADADVDAANLHLLIAPQIHQTHEFVGSSRWFIDAATCTGCGLCADACRFGAIEADGPANAFTGTTFRIRDFLCEGCGLCSLVCPAGALFSSPHVCGEWYNSSTAYGPMVHARLGIAEENSGRLVTAVRTSAREDAGSHLILTDGPPGIGCPVTAAVTGSTLVIVVTEPTVCGMHDLERMLQLTEHFHLQAGIIINKADLNPRQADAIHDLAEGRNAVIAGSIPYDRRVTESLRDGCTMLDITGGRIAQAVRDVWESVSELRTSICHSTGASALF